MPLPVGFGFRDTERVTKSQGQATRDRERQRFLNAVSHSRAAVTSWNATARSSRLPMAYLPTSSAPERPFVGKANGPSNEGPFRPYGRREVFETRRRSTSSEPTRLAAAVNNEQPCSIWPFTNNLSAEPPPASSDPVPVGDSMSSSNACRRREGNESRPCSGGAGICGVASHVRPRQNGATSRLAAVPMSRSTRSGVTPARCRRSLSAA
jgi:hypothetical protein